MRIPCQAVIREPRRPAETRGKVLSKREQRSESNARLTRIIRFKICLINCVIVWGGGSSLKLCREAVSGFMLILFHTSLATPCHCWWLTHMSIRSLWKNLHFSGTRRTSLTNSPTAKTITQTCKLSALCTNYKYTAAPGEEAGGEGMEGLTE